MAAMARRSTAVPRLARMLFLTAAAAFAQEAGSPPALPTAAGATGQAGSGQAAGQAPDTAAEPDDLVRRTMALDIAGSDYYALVAWVRSLGLEESGVAQELRQRLYDHYGVKPPGAKEPSSRVITIESADATEYLSAKEDGEALVRFSGRVSLSVSDADSGETLRVSADSVVVNRDANVLSARGDVVFERKKADGSDFFIGEAFELDMDDWSGIFLDGQSKRGSGDSSGAAGESGTLFFRADDIVKRGSDVLVFRDGIVSSSDEARPYYSIRASRIWILGGNEWAMRDVTLSVGELPLLYLPFFYYPGEEIVFNPVFGYDERFGRYVQTTTYLLGAKEPKKQEISLLKIAEGSGGYERKVEGVFLRTTREPKKQKTSDFIKVLADVYSNLGGFAGAQAQLASLGPLSSFSGLAGVGVTRSIFSSTAGGVTFQTPYVAANGYASTWNEVDILGTVLPVRFGLELSTSLKLGPVSLSVSSPFYSDPSFNVDFKDRTEHMNWLQFLDQKKDETTIAKISSFTDSLSLSAALPTADLPGWLSFISSASISKLSSSLSWASVLKPTPTGATEKLLFSVDPTREFFAPNEWTMIDAAASISGTLLKYPREARAGKVPGVAAQAGDGAAETDEPARDAVARALREPAAPRAPWAQADKPEAAPAGEASALAPPPLATPETYADRKDLSASLGYSWNPTFSWKTKFQTGPWKEPSDVDWKALYETRSLRNAGTLTLSAALYEGLLGLSAGLSAASQAQDRPTVSTDEAYASRSLRETWARQDAQYRNDKVTGTLKLTSSPFQDVWFLAPTSLSYSLSSLLYEYAFDRMDPSALGDPAKASYKTLEADWTSDTVSAHAVALGLGIRPWGFEQTLTLAANLAPLLEDYSAKLSLKSPWGTLALGTAYAVPSKGADFRWSPLSATLTLGAAPWPVLSSSFVWDLEAEKPKSLSSALSWNGLSLSLAAKEALSYTLLPGSGWVPAATQAFQLSGATIAYKESLKPPPAWRRRIAWTLDVNATAQQSFLRFTDSSLDFVLGLTLKVHEFLDLSLSSTSRNSALWRYYPGFFEIPVEVEVKAVDPIVDLLESFNFLDEAARRRSLFKLKSLSLTATHKLKDWDLGLTFSASPVLAYDAVNGNNYQFKKSFTVTLSWRAVSQIKSTYKSEAVGAAVPTETWD